MTWPGKAECFKTIQQPSIATLVPAPEESINFETSGNLFIEGDNLEVLKLLQKSYLGKVKMIYIDPPYNTGNDFIYPDNYSESLDTYLEYTGQVDNEGRKFSTNTDTDGRFHSKWMNMMYPRLFLAKNLLKEDGVIFISIDDKEVNNLRFLCNEIFGEENFLVSITRRTKSGGGSASHHFAIENDFIISYSKNKLSLEKIFVPHESEYAKRYSLEDEEGSYFWDTMERSYTATKPYKIEAPDGTLLEGKWFRSEERFKLDKIKGETRIIKKTDGNWSVQFKQRMPEGKKIRSIFNEKEFKSSQDDLISIEMESVFPFPKPIYLIKYLSVGLVLNNDIILDFFSGSSTTAHSILDLNHEDGGNRKFICVQLPEPTNETSEAFKAGYTTIAEIGKERIRRVIKKIEKETAEEKKKKVNPTLFPVQDQGVTSQQEPDLGFKVFKLASSNFKIWDAGIPKHPEAIQEALFGHINHITPEAEQEAILYELLLKSGFELTTSVKRLTFGEQTVFSIAEGQLLICLEKKLTHDLIREMAELRPVRVICLDEGFQNNDQLKTNAVQIMKSKGVVNFRTV
ncbi:MAG: site-specific DNA-methyltransferase [Bacteroidetes bacterium]|nr:site-specific DNA-methyltransferase [Bacteroidota bacterium]